MKKNVRKTFRHLVSTKTFYLTTLITLLAVVAVGFFSVLNDSGTVAAQSAVESPENERATREMINYALNFKGNMDDSLSALNQLPCSELGDAELAGKVLGPGVYCLPSANLAGELVLDGQHDPSSVFIFRIAGSLNAKAGSTISLANGAQASNAFFVANDTATVEENSLFNGRILAKNDVTIGEGVRMGGISMSAKGEVTNRSENLGGGTGTLQICKAQTGPIDISNRIFNFTVTGVAGTIAVPVGSCSAPIDVPAGPATITELNTGQLIPSGSFTGNFQLVGVEQITSNSPSTLGLVNLSARTAAINIVEGGPAQQLTLRFINQFAITGFVEICKRAATNNGTPDPDVTGFFTYTIEGVYTTNTQNPTNRVLQQFVAPVGQCTGPIAVTISNPAPTGNPRESTVRVSELPRAGFFLESVSTIPLNREVGQEVLGSIIDAFGNVVPAAGGGYVTVRVIEGATSANETLINFVNRSNPGLVKVCKIAGPGVPVNTLFRFTVRGIGATNAAPPQTAIYGPVERIVDVRAGSPESGGNCQFVPGFGAGAGFAEFQTFVIGTPVRVYENGVSPLNTIPQPAGQLRVSRIRSTSGFFPGVFSPNPDINPGSEGNGGISWVGRAAVPARSEVVEVEFTNFYFRPAPLKVCKIGAGVTGNFTFDITLVSPNGPGNLPLFPPATTSVTVTAGPADNGGFCTVVDGSGFLGGELNAGSTVTIVERAVAGTQVTGIACPTCGPGGLTGNNATRTATLSGANGLRNDVTINTVTFTNAPAAAAPSFRAPFDFDGDGKSDPTVFRPTTGTWWWLASTNGQARSQNWGLGTDKLAPADYDNDGLVDYGVFRDGVWHILRSRDGYIGIQFGSPGDIPQPGDYDGDGKADQAVYRPSNGTWYVNGSTVGFIGQAFGIPTDRPVAADYDGDGRMDVAVYRDGMWYMLGSTSGFSAVNFGLGSDTPVAGDYDGDGRADQAVYRNGMWYLLRSTEGFAGYAFGLPTDRPVPADYNGDRRIDIAVYRDGTWYIQNSDNLVAIQLGTASDTPVPAYRW